MPGPFAMPPKYLGITNRIYLLQPRIKPAKKYMFLTINDLRLNERYPDNPDARFIRRETNQAAYKRRKKAEYKYIWLLINDLQANGCPENRFCSRPSSKISREDRNNTCRCSKILRFKRQRCISEYFLSRNRFLD